MMLAGEIKGKETPVFAMSRLETGDSAKYNRGHN
jgi:hypothetical protein